MGGCSVVGKMLLAAGAMLAATTAHAQYAPYPPPPPYVAYGEVPADDRVFTGARVEAHISYDRLMADLRDEDDFAPSSRDGLGYGGEVGFDFPVGGLTLGGYVGADGSTVRECETLTGGTLCLRAGRSLTAGGRIGVPVGSSLLLFAKGGYTNGQIRVDYRAPVAADNLSLRRNLDGFHLGAGVEAALSGSAYGKLEYVYTRLRRFQVVDTDPDAATDFDRHQIQAGVGIRF